MRQSENILGVIKRRKSIYPGGYEDYFLYVSQGYAIKISSFSYKTYRFSFFFCRVGYACGARIDDEGRFQFSFSETEERGNPSRREKFYPRSCVAAVVLLSTCSELQFRVAVASLYDLPRGKVIQSLAHFLHQGVLIGNPIFRRMNI